MRSCADGEGRGDRHASGMDDRVLSGVIEIQPVGQGAVRQDGVGGRDLRLPPDQGTLRRSTETLSGVDDRPAEVHRRGRKTAPDGVQNEECRPREHGGRYIIQRETGDKAGETAGNGEVSHSSA